MWAGMWFAQRVTLSGYAQTHSGVHPNRCATQLRGRAPLEGWTVSELTAMITRHCGHHRLRAQRLARGWSLNELINRMTQVSDVGQRLVASRVSRWERDQERPSAKYMDALCRVYDSGPVDLGFGTDYSDRRNQEIMTLRALNLEPDGPRASTASGPDSAPPSWPMSERGEQADMVRRRVDETLSGSTLSDSTVSHKEAVAAQYGRTYKTQPPTVFLVNVLADIEDIQVLTDRRLPANQRRDLCAVTAHLAGLVSMTMVNLGQFRQAREWVHTARLAADEAGDPELRAWVATRGAVASLNLGDPYAAATAAREAELLTRHHAKPVTAMAWAILARAAAAMAQSQAARTALRHAESLFDTVDQEQDNSAYAFTTGQLHFYRSHALTTLGENSAARRAQEDALAAFGPGERLDPTLVHMDRALCMVHEGDVGPAADYAIAVLQDLPSAYRPAIVLRRAHAVIEAVPTSRRVSARVKALHEMLAAAAGPSE